MSGPSITRAILDWVTYLADPEKERLFHSGSADEYVLLGEYIDRLEGACERARRRGVTLPREITELVELLAVIERETETSPIYNDGRTTYLDRSGNVVDRPFRHWRAYVATSPKWHHAIELARRASTFPLNT
jgi:hypothetical protein